MNGELQFFYLSEDATTEYIEHLLGELRLRVASLETASLFGRLAMMPPSERLAYNIGITADILSRRAIDRVLVDGLLPEEFDALWELEAVYSTLSKIVARLLLNVKERYTLSSRLGGYFYKYRMFYGGYLDVSNLTTEAKDFQPANADEPDEHDTYSDLERSQDCGDDSDKRENGEDNDGDHH